MRSKKTTTSVAALAALALLVLAAAAQAGRGTTVKASSPVPGGGHTSATANCGTGKVHATGGGFSLGPAPAAPAYLLTDGTISSGRKTWTSQAGSSAAAAFLASFVRCEPNRAGKIIARLTGAANLPPGTGKSLVFRCYDNSHVISGGYQATPPYDGLSDASRRLFVLRNQRISTRRWTITAYNLSGSGGSVTVTGIVLCERNGKRRGVSSVTAAAPFRDNTRSGTTATCARGKHVVSGGFWFTPSEFGSGQVPVPFIERFAPRRSRAWRLVASDLPQFAAPAGAEMNVYAYCKLNRI